MSNKHALLLLVGILAGAIVLGQVAHVSPTGRLRDGFRLLLSEALRRVVNGAKAALAAVFDSVWVMETLKNVFQAVLLSGAGAAAYLFVSPADAESMAAPATVAGFLVFGILMMLVTRRAEQLRDAQTQADEARRRTELAAMLAAALKKD